MAQHARNNGGSVGDKRSALAGAQRNAYVHRDQVGGTKRQDADGRWHDVPTEQLEERQRAREEANKPLTVGTYVKNNAAYILSVAAVAVIAVLLIFGMRMIAGSQPGGEEAYTSPYDWSKLNQTDGRYAYVVDGQVKSRFGIDVAEYNHGIDWDAVAADGVDFAMIRLGYRGATEGDLYLDDYYEDNLAGAKAAGIDCGVYFFSQAITVEEAHEEAAFVLDNLDGVALEYPIAFDLEFVSGVDGSRTADLTDDELTAIADAFCDDIEAAGYQTLVYGNQLDLRSYDVDVMTGRGIWWAEYGVSSPSHYLDIVMWQYTSEGSIAGIEEGGVDLNIDLSGVLQ